MTKVGHMFVVAAQVPGRAHRGTVVRRVAQVVAALFAEFARAARLRGLYGHAVTCRQGCHTTAYLENKP